jgi:hypothetical protein
LLVAGLGNGFEKHGIDGSGLAAPRGRAGYVGKCRSSAAVPSS